jgi:hypothetical protein
MKTERSTEVSDCKDAELASYSVYFGRQRLGRYVCVAGRKYAACDANDRLLGHFIKRTFAAAVFDDLIVEGKR